MIGPIVFPLGLNLGTLPYKRTHSPSSFSPHFLKTYSCPHFRLPRLHRQRTCQKMLFPRFTLITIALCAATTFAWPSLSQDKVPMLEAAFTENSNSLSPLAWMPKPDSAERAAAAYRGETEIVVLWNTTETGRSIYDAEPSEFVRYEYHKPGYTLKDISRKDANAFSIYSNTQGPHQIILAFCCSVSMCGWKVSIHQDISK